MKTITKRELNQHTAQVLAQVDAGEPIVVTERGVQRWRIDVAYPATQIEYMAQGGRLRLPVSEPRAWVETASMAEYTEAAIDALYADSRGDH